MIPRTIHYCWFGNTEKNEDILDCIESWETFCPDFEVKEWNELNFPLEKYPFASKMYNEGKWAFVSDFARLQILHDEGGVYLDTDMLLRQPLEPLMVFDCVLGEEMPGTISAGMIASEKHHPFIAECKAVYDKNPKDLTTIPRVLTDVYQKYPHKDGVKVFPPKTFYPFDAEHIKDFHGQELGPDVIGVHLWHFSWGSPLNKFFKRIGIHKAGKRAAEALGVKHGLKKILGFV
jgi:hypothetical protein